VIKVRVADAFAFGGGFAVQVIQDEPAGRRILRMAENSASYHWEPVPEGAAIEPTMMLPDEIGRPLLDALTRHYQGATDMHTVRADLLHERGRVDKLTDALIRIATEVPGGTHA
jgi:hypothetical protein